MSATGGGFGDYHRASAGRPARDTVRHALAAFAVQPTAAARQAVDLGCGIGRDTHALLAAGFRVCAIDSDAEALATLRAMAPTGAALHTVHARMQDARWPCADLVVASFSLPLMAAGDMRRCWRRIRATLRPGGRFAGQFLGERDGWAGREGVTCITRAALIGLLDGLLLEMLVEEEDDTVTPRGRAKHWHLFHVVALRS